MVIVLAVVFWILSLLPLGHPWKQIIMAVVGLIALLMILSRAGLLTGL